ncbi:MAG: helix-turn-helix domain-containing protein [Pyrinomonadaceae bacterium]
MELIDTAAQKFAYSVDEVSGLTSLSKAFIRKEIRLNHLAIRRFGRRILILRKDLEIYLTNNREPLSGEPPEKRVR